MYIEPNTTVIVLHGVHIDPSYEHTIYFDSLPSQYSYFASKSKYTYTKQTYQRHEAGVIRVQQNANELFDCNYLMFQNTWYGPKWFYAFITDVIYINDNVAEIHYDIDVMQTWFFNQDSTLEPCFVQREHSEDDNIGDNLIPENFELGDYVITHPDSNSVLHTFMGSNEWGNATTWREENWCIVVMLNSYVLGTLPCHLNYTGGTAHQAAYKIFDCDAAGWQEADDWLQSHAWSWLSEAITTVYMFPKNYLPHMVGTDVPGEGTIWWGGSTPSNGYTASGSDNSFGVQFDKDNCYGFTPQNNKLFTFPYCFLRVSNGQGSVIDYRWERFVTDIAYFRIFGSLSANPSLTLYPTGYKNIGGLVDGEKLTITDLPTVTHVTNDFTAKLVQKTIGLALTATGVSVGGAWGALMTGEGGPATRTKSRYMYDERKKKGAKKNAKMRTYMTREMNDTTTTTSEQPYDNEAKLGRAAASVASIIGDTSSSASVGDSNTALSVGLLDFTAYKMHITDEFAKIIDNFFSMYGYATNRVKVPNINSRPHWNYVKTTNCNVHGSMPAGVMEEIQDIFNDGITFWKNGDEVGDYSLDNRPITGGGD